MLVFTTYPRQRILLARWSRQCRLSGCHLGTKLPCSLQPDGQKLHLQHTHERKEKKTCSKHWDQSQSGDRNVFLSLLSYFFIILTARAVHMILCVKALLHSEHWVFCTFSKTVIATLTNCQLKKKKIFLPMTNTGMKAPLGTGMVVASADIQNWV